MNQYTIQTAKYEHLALAEEICRHMEESAKARGTGIAKRSPDYIKKKMLEGKAVVATDKQGNFVGFCYIESWGHGKFVANSGLIVHPDHRKSGIAKDIKKEIFKLTRSKYPESKIFGITTSLAVMKINSALGYEPVPFSELTDDDDFWKGCSSCVNYDVLTRTNRKMCICTGMLYDPAEAEKKERESKWNFNVKTKVYERWLRLKESVLSKFRNKNGNGNSNGGGNAEESKLVPMPEIKKPVEREKILVYSAIIAAIAALIKSIFE
ncbi:GNAT family N-acetyltransferase [Cytophagaceae bacterium DM2B3-1]|uniref:GNAT family N-acetyltransferase n=1 Tax=Xanthocytophaga flava TaxID=3048013 RepID=A0ABT7CCK1_9BACT|nr:GNAT family N-acetyltransferase [Xanthocytophaga flavus]MDJ1470038.1 GNAT family N-acetyltransferase [Xanthocytophaga flavus]MDJ1491398.1 GNAT family N-acetyltransferase [Xanthocytophaga flavus]